MITTWPDDHLLHHQANAARTSPHCVKPQDFHKPNLPKRLAFPSAPSRFTSGRQGTCLRTFFRSLQMRSAYQLKPLSEEVRKTVNADPSRNSKDNLKPSANFLAPNSSKYQLFWKPSLLSTKPRPLEFFFSWVGTRWAVRALAIHCPAAAKGGGGCGLTRETWNEIGRHIAGTSCLRTMLAAADYGRHPRCRFTSLAAD